MSVRREVISLSQLLQRRKTGSTPSTVRNSPQANTPSTPSYEQARQIPRSQATPTPSTHSFGPFHPRITSQPLRSSQQHQPEKHKVAPISFSQNEQYTENKNRRSGSSYLQSQETAYEDLTGFTSQSQTLFSQSQNMLFASQEEASRSRASSVSHRQRALPSKLSSDEKERSENDLLDKFSAPIQSELTNLSTSISIQSADHKTQLDALKTIVADVSTVNESLKLLNNQNDEMKSHFDKCHESLSKEANATSSAVKSLHSRFAEMESHVSNFTSEISSLLKKEQMHRKARKNRHASVERPRECNSAHLTSRRKRKEYFSPSKDSVCIPKQKNYAFCSQPDSQRGKAADDEGGSDEFGLQRTLQRIEEARAKRRRSKYFTAAL